MKNAFSIFVGLLLCNIVSAQKIENVIIVTTDGFRWQEVFKGMDSTIAMNPAFNQDDALNIFKKYWAPTVVKRRQRLLPFLWSTVAAKGQLYGNREFNVNVNNANPYWFSYPGYNEIFTGYADTLINSNSYPANPNTNLLEFIDKQNGFKGTVAAFCAWNAFDKILSEKRSGISVVCGQEACGGAHPDIEQQTMNRLKKDAFKPWDGEALDVFTHYAAMDYLKKQQPRVLYISYGETDEWAHSGRYKDYLEAAHAVDKWLADLWSYIQSSANYKGKTLLFVTVDHGRGYLGKDDWTSHNAKIVGSDQIWFAAIGPGIAAKGEIKTPVQLYQKQYAQTIAGLLGYTFTCEHPVADGFADMLK